MDTHENSLPIGTLLDNRYKIKAILGEGGFGVTYKAHDNELDYTVVIKEFLPQECAARAGDSVSVQPRTNRTDDYQYGLERFLDEARTLAKFQHPNIVTVTNFLKVNGTAYFVMNYAEGEDLSDWLKKHEVLNEDIILKIITPILKGLAEVHKAGLLHRDIKPGNIFMRKQGGPMLIDFGAARQALGEHSKSISAIISQGYAPPEQYTTRGKQGPFTDLYAVGAVLYKLITSGQPIESTDRSHAVADEEPDPLVPCIEAGKGKVSDWLLQLTDQMLQLRPKFRLQTAEAVLDAIKNKTTDVVAVGSSEKPGLKQSDNKTRVVRSSDRFAKKPSIESKPKSSKDKHDRSGLIIKITVGLVVLVALAGGGWWYSQVLEQQHLAELENIKRLARIEEDRQAEVERLAELAKRQTEAEAVRQSIAEQWATIPSGAFEMGSTGGYDDEKPVHSVHINSFLLARYEVTRAEFDTFIQATGYRTDAEKNAGGNKGCYIYKGGADKVSTDFGWSEAADWRNPGFEQSDNEPVVCVSWNDAQAYIKWRSELEGEHYRLPTEAEWEYAARAGSTSRYSYGDDKGEMCRHGNGADQTARQHLSSLPAINNCLDNHTFTAPAGSFTANQYGLYDMHGNVTEFQQDCWNYSYSGAPDDGSAWLSGECKKRVVRGGSWYGGPAFLRSSSRGFLFTHNRSVNDGFRIARDL